ncbi:MAG: iron ABC transporter permease [Chloroflexota bacterium]|nr:iron ABC transporter permease [Chloroflexota bacterium]
MRRLAWVLGALALLLLLGVFLGISLGPAKMDFGRVMSGLLGRGDVAASVLVWDLRLPRAVTALVAGACLGAAGCLLQSSTRNPLGDPQLFGLGGGAAVVQALAMAGTVRTGAMGLVALSVAASLVGAGVIAFFASRQELSPARLALIGVSVAALLGAVATGILAEARVFSQQSVAFLGGSFTNRGWPDALAALPYLAFGLALALPAVGRLNLLALGDRVAANLGAEPNLTRIMATAAAGVLAGAAVALAGLVGFVGLMVPHLARLLVGHDFRAIFIVSIPLGAFVTLYADQAARLAFMPSEVPVGMVTALVGAPLMIYVARRVLWT